jgi:hypothetical protein
MMAFIYAETRSKGTIDNTILSELMFLKLGFAESEGSREHPYEFRKE